MTIFAARDAASLERRELHLALFACLSLLIVAIGAAVLMYPVAYYNESSHANHNVRAVFWGFCGLGVLLTAYLWESNATIRHLAASKSKPTVRLAAVPAERLARSCSGACRSWTLFRTGWQWSIGEPSQPANSYRFW